MVVERDCLLILLIAVERYPPAHDIGVDTVPRRNGGYGNTGLLTLLDDLGFEGVRIGLTLAYGVLGVKGNCARLNFCGHNCPSWLGSEGVFAGNDLRTSMS